MTLLLTHDGSHTLLEERYGATYHSRHGAVTESAHVFIGAGLLHKMAAQRVLAVLEVGLGTGLNAFMTLLEAERHGLHIRYTALEPYPITAAGAGLFNYPVQLQVPERKPHFLRLHTCPWHEPVVISETFTFEKQHTPAEQFSARSAFDLVYFDAFAPQVQPELWTEAVFARLHEAIAPGGVLVTYCAQGAFRRTLRRVGFSVECLPGPPGKREMTRGTKGAKNN